MSDSLYSARGLTKCFGVADSRVEALRGVDFDILPNDFVAITGPSGSGKSTLLGLMGILARPTSGELLFCGEDLTKLGNRKQAALRNARIGFVFQSFQLLPRTSAQENVELPLLYAGVPTKQRHQRARTALDRVGLTHRASHLPEQLSGGEQQRVAIARAIVNEPDVVLADEPTGALDSRTGRHIVDLLAELNTNGTAIVVITHNLEVADRLPRNLALVDGLLQQRGADRTEGTGA